jgi:hypothetical protein
MSGIVFANSLFIVLRKAIDFCVLTLYHVTLASKLIPTFLNEIFMAVCIQNCIICQQTEFTSSFPVCIPVVSFLYLITLATASTLF